MSDSSPPYGLQHARPPCASPTPGVYSNSCPLSQWCHPTILYSVVPFSSRLQSFPASGSETYFHQYDAFHHSSVQFSRSVMSNSLWPHEVQHARPPCPSPTPRVHSNSPPSSQWWHPAISYSVVPFSSCPQSLPEPVFSDESTLHMRWPKYWSFSFSIIPSNEHPGLISCKKDWLDLLAVQGTLKSLLHHHSSKASILRCSVFFTVQLLHPYTTTGKTIALTRRTFVGKVMS